MIPPPHTTPDLAKSAGNLASSPRVICDSDVYTKSTLKLSYRTSADLQATESKSIFVSRPGQKGWLDLLDKFVVGLCCSHSAVRPHQHRLRTKVAAAARPGHCFWRLALGSVRSPPVRWFAFFPFFFARYVFAATCQATFS